MGFSCSAPEPCLEGFAVITLKSSSSSLTLYTDETNKEQPNEENGHTQGFFDGTRRYGVPGNENEECIF